MNKFIAAGIALVATFTAFLLVLTMTGPRYTNPIILHPGINCIEHYLNSQHNVTIKIVHNEGRATLIEGKLTSHCQTDAQTLGQVDGDGAFPNIHERFTQGRELCIQMSGTDEATAIIQ